MSNIVEPTILPFKCQDVLVKLGSSCEKQKEIYDHLYNLNTGVTTLAPNSVSIGSGLGDSSWNEALNYEKTQAELNKKLSEEAEVKSVGYISNLQVENKKKDYIIYGVALVLVLGVIIYEFKSKK
jgi:hypothetical protein